MENTANASKYKLAFTLPVPKAEKTCQVVTDFWAGYLVSVGAFSANVDPNDEDEDGNVLSWYIAGIREDISNGHCEEISPYEIQNIGIKTEYPNAESAIAAATAGITAMIANRIMDLEDYLSDLARLNHTNPVKVADITDKSEEWPLRKLKDRTPADLLAVETKPAYFQDCPKCGKRALKLNRYIGGRGWIDTLECLDATCGFCAPISELRECGGIFRALNDSAESGHGNPGHLTNGEAEADHRQELDGEGDDLDNANERRAFLNALEKAA